MAILFVEAPSSPEHVFVRWGDPDRDSFIADGFADAADMVVERFVADKCKEHPDRYFFAVVFLYRHAIELRLKVALRDVCYLSRTEHPPAMNGHDLIALWRPVIEFFTKLAKSKVDPETQWLGEVIAELNRVDARAQSFRYHRDRRGEEQLTELPKTLSIADVGEKLRSCYDRLTYLSDDARDLIEHELERPHSP